MSVRLPVIRQLSAIIASFVLTVMLATPLAVSGGGAALAAENMVVAQAFPGQGQYQMPPAFEINEDDADQADTNQTDTEEQNAAAPNNASMASTTAANPAPPRQEQTPDEAGNSGNDYVLDSGDRLRVTVFGEEDLSGEFEIDGKGRIYMPLIGAVTVGNKTLQGAQNQIINLLMPDYLKNPKVSLEVMNYRDFYILGEVNSPGNFPFQNGLTVINAVALAGGYTGRASKENITVVRNKDPKQKETRIGLEEIVFPGDILRVKQRLF